ncbi:efflux RND transporter permease subunit [Sulfuricurvum sp.]|uniref:efflux RND transporter permease subunit n=1 Tax=Sulfuricurvum sp. TaxID=2025608 RepID=UPI003564C606
MFEFFYRRPYHLVAIVLTMLITGVIGLATLPKNLFPDSDRPTVVVITQAPGMTAKVAASSVSKPIEEEIARLGLIRTVSSTNMANFSIVRAEFEYDKGLEGAAVDVTNALSTAKAKLPAGLNPTVYVTGAFTLPVEVVSMSPKNATLTLADIRKISDSFIKPRLLSTPGIGNVEVFGGHQSALSIRLDSAKVASAHLDMETIAKTISALDKDTPLGFVKNNDGFTTLTYYGEKSDPESLSNLSVAPNLRLGDIASVSWSEEEPFSAYFGNGTESIALSIQRSAKGSVLATSKIARDQIAQLSKKYPNIDFTIVDTQRDLIETANSNMLEALRDAIIFTLIVLLFFLGNLRAIAAAALSIPLVFLGTIGVIWLGGGELNIVVYTAIILALGMLVDDAVVVLENIERHLVEMHESLEDAIIHGTREVIAPVFAGTIATIVIIAPLMFVGDFPQTIYRPLISTLIIALIVSYILSITLIPKFSAYLYRNGVTKNRFEVGFEHFYQNTMGRLVSPYLSILHFSNTGRTAWRKALLVVGVLALLVVSMKVVMPLIGKDAMPPMDTGIVKVKIAFSSNDRVEDATAKLKPFFGWLNNQKYVRTSSTAFGSEEGVLSLGSGSLSTEATMTILCTNRFERTKTLWQIEEEIRSQLGTLAGVKSVDVYDFGATANSSIKAPLDIRLTSAVPDELYTDAKTLIASLQEVRGLTSITPSWREDMSEIDVSIDTDKALSYGLTPLSILSQIPIRGQIVALSGNLASMNNQPVRLYLAGSFQEHPLSLENLPINSNAGIIPLSAVATLNTQMTPAKLERDGLLYSLDVNGYRAKRPITHITDDAEAVIKQLTLNSTTVTQQGDIVQLNDSFKRMIKAIGVGVLLLFVVLTAIYASARLAGVMILVLPLSMIGAAWGMLLFDKPSCMPSMLGILLLFGIIIKNSVLLIDFYQAHRKTNPPYESAVESVKVRFRPVMMTAFGTIAGMLPIAFEWAVGLERLSPLADVAIGGLLVGTLLTLVYVPLAAYSIDTKGEV